METFSTNICLNDIEYTVEVTGNYDKGQQGSFYDPEIKPSFEIKNVWISPNNSTGLIDLNSPEYSWLLTQDMLNEIEKDFFMLLKEEHYDGY